MTMMMRIPFWISRLSQRKDIHLMMNAKGYTCRRYGIMCLFVDESRAMRVRLHLEDGVVGARLQTMLVCSPNIEGDEDVPAILVFEVSRQPNSEMTAKRMNSRRWLENWTLTPPSLGCLLASKAS
jgi:uncharacterized protein YbbC (DUF1343 family)